MVNSIDLKKKIYDNQIFFWMKLRFEKNSVRYRIKKSELQQLKKDGVVKDTVAFPGAVLTYELRIADVSTVTPSLAGDTITINIPAAIAHQWIDTEEVGIYASISTAEHKTLEVTVEKDFPCKDRTDEDKSDTFTELVEKDSKGKVC